MEVLGILNIPVWLILLVAVFILYYMYMRKYYGIFKKMGVSGPEPKFPMGTIGEFFKKGMKEVDMEFYKKYNRVYGTFEGRFPILNIGRPELIKEIMVKDFNNFVNRRNFKQIQSKNMVNALTIIEDDHWKFVRNTITPTFSGKKLRQMTPLINNAGERLVENVTMKVQNKEDIDIKQALSGFTLDVISSTAFGMEVDSQKNPNDAFVKMCRMFFDTKFIGIIVTIIMFFPFAGRGFMAVFRLIASLLGRPNPEKYLSAVLQHAIDDRRKNPGKNSDFLNIVLATQKEKLSKNETERKKNEENGALQTSTSWTRKHLTDDEIMAQSLLFLLAGFETTASSLTYTLYHLALYPEAAEKAIEEVDRVVGQKLPTYDNIHELQYIDMCISETLRLYPPAIRVDRIAKNDVKIGGLDVPKGMVVAMPIQAIHLDPEYWTEPEKFDPERFTPEAKAARDPFTYLPFGHGPRNCIGMRLALLEQKIALVRILQKFKPSKCDKTQIPLKMSKLGNLVDPKDGVWIKLEERE